MNITIIGAGNVASHLALTLHQAGYTILQIYSRQLSKARPLAEHVDAPPFIS